MTLLRQAPEAVPARAIAIVVIAATVIGVAAVLIAWWMTPAGLHEGARLVPDPRAVIGGTEQEPLLEAPSRSARTQARERARLERYELIDTQRARIPIARAVELLLSGRRPEGAGAAAFPSTTEAR